MPWASSLLEAVNGALADSGRSVTLERNGTVLPTQTFVLDWYGLRADERALVETASGESGGLAVRMHAAADADIERGDQFAIENLAYRVVMAPPGDGSQRIAYAHAKEF